jgi:futalosine hydrolase
MQAVLGARAQGVFLGLNRPHELAWGPRTLLLVITGIGMVNAAMALGRLAARAPELAGVLNIGIAGSFDPGRFPLGSVVAVQTEIWPEFGLVTEQGVDPRGLGLGHGRAQGGIVWDTLSWDPDREAQAMGLGLCSQWPRVTSLSVSGVSGTEDRAAYLRSRTQAEVENMEGFALGWACAVHGLPFVQIRSISNRVGSRDPGEWAVDRAFSSLGTAALRILGPGKDPLPGKRQ